MAVSESKPTKARITQCGFGSFLRDQSQESVHLSSGSASAYTYVSFKHSGSESGRWIALSSTDVVADNYTLLLGV